MLIVVALFFVFFVVVVVATVATTILLAGSHASSYNMLLLNKFPKKLGQLRSPCSSFVTLRAKAISIFI